ncbi:MAG: Fpg/Nei family DNA glycosylase [Micromonosporaceae bacterium]|nr:Fpg/Nei family DNA glycosylase [Micromonosporaceae bacterium]
MPELPEVEALAAYLRERAVGHAVRAVEVAAISVLKTYDPPPTALAGAAVTGVGRHGKFLDLVCGKPAGAEDEELHLVVHLARAGWLTYRESLQPRPAKPGKGPLALRVRLDDGSGLELTEAGTQKRLACYLVRDPRDVPGVARLGPDPLTLDEAGLAERVRAQRGQLKGVLTDQRVLAGIGNAYSDEILHAAKLSPFARADRLADEAVTRLHQAVRSVLVDAVARSAGQCTATLKSEKRSGLKVHARAGLPCPVCGDTVREVSFSDTSLQYCPTCQTGGRTLADRRLSRLLR